MIVFCPKCGKQVIDEGCECGSKDYDAKWCSKHRRLYPVDDQCPACELEIDCAEINMRLR